MTAAQTIQASNRRPNLEVADIFRDAGPDFIAEHPSWVSPEEIRVLKDLAVCRTAALGGHLERCDSCPHERNAYNSCRNRHCPKCQASARAEWMEARSEELLPVHYFHSVFTLDHDINPIALQNKRVVYAILFKASSETLLQIAADPKHLGARIGFFGILHTWGQNILQHPHVHYVIPGGGISPDATQWISCPENFFLPVKVLSRVFRGKFLDYLQQAYNRGELSFHGSIKGLNNPTDFKRYINKTRKSDWAVYSKPPFGGPEQVLKYLARYTYRVAISNSRLVAYKDGKVSFSWKDYKDSCTTKIMTLQANEFIRRFLLHVLPKGFMRIRYYGFMANRHRANNLELCRALLGADPTLKLLLKPKEENFAVDPSPEPLDETSKRCPFCKKGRMLIEEILKPDTSLLRLFSTAHSFDTS